MACGRSASTGTLERRPACLASAAPLSELPTYAVAGESANTDAVGRRCILQTNAAGEEALTRAAQCQAAQLRRQQNLKSFQRRCQRRVAQQRQSERSTTSIATASLAASGRCSANTSASTLPGAWRRLDGSDAPLESFTALARSARLRRGAALHGLAGGSGLRALNKNSTPDLLSANKHIRVSEASLISSVPVDLPDMLDARRVDQTTKKATEPVAFSGAPTLLESKKPRGAVGAADRGGSSTLSRCASLPNVAAGGHGDRSTRYTAGLLSLLLRAYAKRNRRPPALCACIPCPSGDSPTIGHDGNLSHSLEWEAWVHKMGDSSAHACNCVFASSLPRLQKQILVLIQGAKQA